MEQILSQSEEKLFIKSKIYSPASQTVIFKTICESANFYEASFFGWTVRFFLILLTETGNLSRIRE